MLTTANTAAARRKLSQEVGGWAEGNIVVMVTAEGDIIVMITAEDNIVVVVTAERTTNCLSRLVQFEH